jgi:5-hydroxyisourate hydrolase-like protein (transthyretin family)
VGVGAAVAFAALLSTAAVPAHQAVHATVSGQVIAESNGAPMPGVQVMLSRVSGSDSQRLVTSTDGRFGFSDLEAGAYRLTFSLQGFRTVVRFALVAPGSQRVVRVVLRVDPDAVFEGIIEARRPVDTYAAATVVGFVTDAGGVVWPGVKVRVRRLGPGTPTELVSGGGGEFRLGVEPGVYRILLGAQAGFRPEVRDEVVVERGAVVRVEGRIRPAHEFEYGGGQASGPGHGDLRIRVTDAAGHPIGAARVSMPDAPFGDPRSTDAMGQLWTVLPAGRYSLRVEVAGFETKTVFPVAITAGSETHTDVTLELLEKYRRGR